MLYKLVGQRIQKFRKERKLSQQELANRVNVTKNHIGNIERGNTSVSLEVLERICQVLDVLPEQVVSNYEIMKQVNNPQVLLSIIDLLKDQPIEVQKELLKIISVFLKSFETLLSEKQD
ncbi:helix-turn-helix domain-containing protein [Ferdinandcohnia sp. Marseille-Q9671]